MIDRVLFIPFGNGVMVLWEFLLLLCILGGSSLSLFMVIYIWAGLCGGIEVGLKDTPLH